ncbi:hypothetical protein [Novosphingobium sp. BL-8A]|uniref:hypothetical protein n=1 Tax=Novosphingobium sp. BL-8A TaxID=3127639 RepID=UPI003756BC85
MSAELEGIDHFAEFELIGQQYGPHVGVTILQRGQATQQIVAMPHVENGQAQVCAGIFRQQLVTIPVEAAATKLALVEDLADSLTNQRIESHNGDTYFIKLRHRLSLLNPGNTDDPRYAF